MPRASQRGAPPPAVEPAGPATPAYLAKWGRRHTKAEGVARQIESYAFPTTSDDPGAIETFAGEDPSALGGAMGGMAPGFGHINAEQTLRKWEVPGLPESHHEGFGSSNAAKGTKTGIETWVNNLGRRMDVGDPLEAIVRNRKESLSTAMKQGDPDANWYQGEGGGGKAQALIHHAAQEIGVPSPVVRKATAASSPQQAWDLQYADNPQNRRAGVVGQVTYPNLEVASSIVGIAKGKTPEEARAAMATSGLPGVGRQKAAHVAASMMGGTMHASERLPISTGAEKTQSFDLNLSDPTHPIYGYSSWVDRHRLRAHTGDVQDARAGGFHEEQLAVPTTSTAKKPKQFHEVMLGTPAGADITASTALVARTEHFSMMHQRHGEEWAKQNAKSYLAAPAQSMQWSVNRKEGVIDIPEHVAASYNARPQGGSREMWGSEDEMSEQDWKEM